MNIGEIGGLKTADKTPIVSDKKVDSRYKEINIKKPRLKVGDLCKLYWKQRTSPKGSVFCGDCGTLYEGIQCKGCGKTSVRQFPKLMGEVEITEVFEIEMERLIKGEWGYFVISPELDDEELSKRDGFKSTEEGSARTNMFNYFDKQYDLSSPKRFAVYRWKWC